MVKEAGFAVVEKGFDGTLFSIVCSELYEQDIPLQSNGLNNLAISPERLTELNRLVAEHNASGDGDSGWFVLERA